MAYEDSISELSSGQFILSGYIPAVLDDHLRSARRRFWKVDNSEIADGEEAQISVSMRNHTKRAQRINIQLPKTDIVVKTGLNPMCLVIYYKLNTDAIFRMEVAFLLPMELDEKSLKSLYS